MSGWNFLVPIALVLAACGHAADPAPPPASPAPHVEPPPPPTPQVDPPPPPPPPAPEKEPEAEKCEGGWVCVKVDFATRKVEPRPTKLLGDPKIDSTWSKSSDGRTVSFDAFSGGAVELTLKRRPADRNEVVVKIGKGPEIVIDRHDGSPDVFSHVGAIATEQGGALLVDLRYLK